MSAFIVSAETMNKVVRAIVSDEYRGEFAGITLPGYTISDRKPQATAIGKELFAMNRAAILARYPGDTEYAETPKYRYKPVRYSEVEMFKAMECLLYQCSEGNVPDTDLYKELEAAKGSLASRIVSNMPEYESAAWD